MTQTGGMLFLPLPTPQFVFRSLPRFSEQTPVGSASMENTATCWALWECQLTLSLKTSPKFPQCALPGCQHPLHHPHCPENKTKQTPRHTHTYTHTENSDQNVTRRTTVDTVEEKGYKDFFVPCAFGGHFVFNTTISCLRPLNPAFEFEFKPLIEALMWFNSTWEKTP